MASDVLSLCYHAVSERWPAELSITPARLERQLDWLARHGYRSVGFNEAVTMPPRGRVVAITFDDAYSSLLELALPILDRAGMVATVFVPTQFPDSGELLSWPGIERWVGSEYAGELTPLSWAELARLADAGWEIGSHTKSHPKLTQLDDAELEDELSGSRSACTEALGRPCLSIAYPYGDHDERVVTAAATAGYSSAGTLPRRLHEPSPLRWPRLGVYHDDSQTRFRIKVSRRVRRLRSAQVWESLGPSG